MKLLITGATGYIGTRLVKAAIDRGYQVVSLSRQPGRQSEVEWIKYDLAIPVEMTLPDDASAVVHLAANLLAAAGTESIDEVKSARLLLKAASKIGAKFIFVSSQTAQPDAPTEYGRIKWQIEQEVLAAGGWVVRPGQVYGANKRALFGTLADVVEKMPILPAFLPAPTIHPIHVDDLAEGLLRLAESDAILSDVVQLGSPKPVSFTDFLAVLASARIRRRRFFMPVPIILIRAISALTGPEFLTRVGVGRLLSLFDLPSMNSAEDLKRLTLRLRPLKSGMHPSGDDRRRRLFVEGRCLLTYLLKSTPSTALLRRYVHVIERMRGGLPLSLPAWVLRSPGRLALLDDQTVVLDSKGRELGWRLNAATMLAEATSQGAERFLNRRQHPSVAAFNLLVSGAAEIGWRLARIACAPMIANALLETKDGDAS